jgi:16S rRNA (guanine527-N7)-methyltransferase
MKAHRARFQASEDLLLSGALAVGLEITPDQRAAFGIYREEITRWSARLSLTGFHQADEIIRGGFLDSLACLPLIPQEARHAVDIGSGAGFPAIPLKLARPNLSFTLVESSRKKTTFLQHIIRRLQLSGVRVVWGRAELLGQDPRETGRYDLALARAVAPPLDQMRLARPFLHAEGRFILQAASALDETMLERAAGLGFAVAQEVSLAASLGRPGCRVVALQRLG